MKKAIFDQFNKISHSSTLYLHPSLGNMCQKIADKLPKKLSNVILVNSGSEANDLACLLARMHTGNHTIFALNAAYHGWAGSSAGLTSLSTWKYSFILNFGR